ncbi:hypothetical protein [Pseudomonas oligotrophica]|uniref:hypothetical protein n=1 Tax=Pseudomonas oligotrophica TaxID=2912055 RepID=UPI001F36ABC6|nr:hypothetical protein [Pseudomonas oligotrophica]MCF7202720.1 hypothetical protein [Pseudomonas oligotrophica]
MNAVPPPYRCTPDEEPDITQTDAGESEPGEDPDFDEAGEGVPDAPRDAPG